MSDRSDQATLRLYLGLMEEAKARANAINTLANNSMAMPAPFVREYCYLQLRMLCELVAIACLVAHGDIDASKTNDLRKAWHPDQILPKLQGLHPKFYPVPTKPEKTWTGWHMADYEGGPYISKEELRVLHGKCGGILHHRNLKRLEAPQTEPAIDLSEVFSEGQKVMNLLSNHRIMCLSGRKVLIAFLDLSGMVQVAFGEAPLDQQ